MISLKSNFITQIKSSPYYFPLSIICLHSLTYFSYFSILNHQTLEYWPKLTPYVPMILVLPEVYFPNLIGIFLITQLFNKKTEIKLIVLYLCCLIFEHFIMTLDIMDDFENDIPKFTYYLLYTRIDFKFDFYRYIYNISIAVALIHIAIICFKRKMREKN
jgi:hypothetical protein